MGRDSAAASVVTGATVLVTGAAGGMGALYARRAAREGAARIALWDVDDAGIRELADELETPSTTVRGFAVDLSDRDNIADAAARTRELVGDADVLINNAGIVRGKTFWEHDPTTDIELTMRINSLAPMWLTRELLPSMITDTARPKRILNIASAAGTLANPNMSVYSASKWAMIGWSESLRLELHRAGHRHIAVTTFCPSYVSTGMFAGARGPLWTPIMTPEQAVTAAWQGMQDGRPIVARPWTVKLGMAARGLLPTRVWDVVADRIFGVYSSMDHFTGRAER
ncbi:SDR family NAD(P)-dependent oxidoreductase [Microlunatus soli]|uniref:Short-chain dehydrogenase n=1 Tax=Microlunatus soli TaxID=630515 RepID=A0A1H1UQ77_9ACTN|nr:SDR family NAD(P)-dependent oxidoreductase [Microlunatus soli]SDS74724.1 Short-chain dehydrogenase [Microlunatus soli]